MTQSFDVFIYLRLNKRLSKQSRRWWLETPSRLLWRNCNDQPTRWKSGAKLLKSAEPNEPNKDIHEFCERILMRCLSKYNTYSKKMTYSKLHYLLYLSRIVVVYKVPGSIQDVAVWRVTVKSRSAAFGLRILKSPYFLTHGSIEPLTRRLQITKRLKNHQALISQLWDRKTAGTHFTNIFKLKIQIWWKIVFLLR